MMTDKSIQEMRSSYGEEASGILQVYYREIDDIRDYQRLDEVAIPVQLTREQARNLLLEQKTAKAEEARRQALVAYRTATEQHHGAVVERSGFLKERLFSVPGPEGGGVSRAGRHRL